MPKDHTYQPSKAELEEPIVIDATPDELARAAVTPIPRPETPLEVEPRAGTIPFAKWRGKIDLGGNELDVYVLITGDRVIALRSAIKSISGADTGSLASYVGAVSLKPFINSDLLLAELLEFSIPGIQFTGRGMTTEHFELICRAYVQALYERAALTDRQREIAVKCAVLTAGLTRPASMHLSMKPLAINMNVRRTHFRLSFAPLFLRELRAWEKTFPDELWEEFGRLTGWATPLQSRPKWWGKLVTELIYDTLDDDVATYLKENRPPPSVRWHQQLTETYGVRQLVSRCYEVVGMAKTCETIHELRNRVAQHYGKKAMQFTLFLKPRSSSTDSE